MSTLKENVMLRQLSRKKSRQTEVRQRFLNERTFFHLQEEVLAEFEPLNFLQAGTLAHHISKLTYAFDFI